MSFYEMIPAYLKRFDPEKLEYRFQADTIEEHQSWRKRAEKRLWEIAGIGLCEKAEPEAKKLAQVQEDGYQVETWVIQTEPEIWMPFDLYRPLNPNHALILNPHGHGMGRKSNNPIELVQAGYTVACPDERGSGERREECEQTEGGLKQRNCSHGGIESVAIGFGQAMIGMAVWDLMRLTDFLVTLSEIDATKIGCMGMSGGGQQTLWFSALDERVKAAVTSGYYYGEKDSLIYLYNNCPCNYVPYMWRTMDMGDLGAMTAPRALFVESGEKDNLNGPRGLANVYPQVDTARKAYALYGREDHVIHSIHPGGHQWVGKGVKEFFDRELLNK